MFSNFSKTIFSKFAKRNCSTGTGTKVRSIFVDMYITGLPLVCCCTIMGSIAFLDTGFHPMYNVDKSIKKYQKIPDIYPSDVIAHIMIGMSVGAFIGLTYPVSLPTITGYAVCNKYKERET